MPDHTVSGVVNSIVIVILNVGQNQYG